MPRPVVITDEDRQWLRQHHHHHSYSVLAQRLGCCTDTLKRILAREGLQEFDSAKYAVCPTRHTKTWSRPCMGCGSTKPRPKNHYFCKPCRRGMGYEDE